VRERGRRGRGAGSEGGRTEGGRGKGVREGGGREGRRGEGVTEGGGSDGGGRELWVVLGPRCGLWVVVVGVHCCSWWWALSVSSSFLFIICGCSTCLGHSFPSMTWPLTGGGGVTSRVLC